MNTPLFAKPLLPLIRWTERHPLMAAELIAMAATVAAFLDLAR